MPEPVLGRLQRVGHRPDDGDLEPVEDPDRAQTDHDHPVPARPRQPVQPCWDVGGDLTGLDAAGHVSSSGLGDAIEDVPPPPGGMRRDPARGGSAGEEREQGVVERRQVVGLAARDEVAVDDDLLVDPVGAGVAQVGLQARPRRHPPAPHDVGLDQRPGRVADGRHRLVRSTKSRTNDTASWSVRRASGLATPPGSTSAS